MQEMLEKYQLSGSHLIAEMTESCVDERPDRLLHFVELCNELGIQIALDDFGNGYSSLRMLLQYPSSIIKLDRTLLAEMIGSADKMSFILSIVYACHQFGKIVCMEGVETAEQASLIQESGCDLIQGFYYYRPLEIDAIYELLAAESQNAPEQSCLYRYHQHKRDAQRTSLHTARVPDNLRNPRFYSFLVIG